MPPDYVRRIKEAMEKCAKSGRIDLMRKLTLKSMAIIAAMNNNEPIPSKRLLANYLRYDDDFDFDFDTRGKNSGKKPILGYRNTFFNTLSSDELASYRKSFEQFETASLDKHLDYMDRMIDYHNRCAAGIDFQVRRNFEEYFDEEE
ncbi:unnamed protein product [Rotaria sp. Silwood1]|nr:unnamed protein product [Rotaria sp. Silwood1]